MVDCNNVVCDSIADWCFKMRKPKPSDCDDGCGEVDWECFNEAMGDFEDSERDRELEERMERQDERERYADYSDQEE